MARGRMLSRTLGTSRKFAATGKRAGEFPQLLFSLMVPHTDDFGRMPGDAFTVKNRVFPTSPRTEEEFDSALVALEGTNLIVRYDDGHGNTVLQIMKFDEHQQGLHKRTRSEFPAPPAHLPGVSGKVREIPSELKGTEVPPKPPARGGPSRRRDRRSAQLDQTHDQHTRTTEMHRLMRDEGLSREDAAARAFGKAAIAS